MGRKYRGLKIRVARRQRRAAGLQTTGRRTASRAPGRSCSRSAEGRWIVPGGTRRCGEDRPLAHGPNRTWRAECHLAQPYQDRRSTSDPGITADGAWRPIERCIEAFERFPAAKVRPPAHGAPGAVVFSIDVGATLNGSRSGQPPPDRECAKFQPYRPSSV